MIFHFEKVAQQSPDNHEIVAGPSDEFLLMSQRKNTFFEWPEFSSGKINMIRRLYQQLHHQSPIRKSE